MRHPLSICLGLLAGIVGIGVTEAAGGAQEYAALAARLRGGDLGTDFRALRLAYAHSEVYRPNSAAGIERRREVQAALERKDYAAAAAAAAQWLEQEYVNPFAHLGAARAEEGLGRLEAARFHNRVADGLYESICAPGEGRSPDRPCQVISRDEEFFYLARHNYEVGVHYEETCAGERPCSVYEVREAGTDQLIDLHFDVSLPFAAQRAASTAPAPER
jgi:hypothetical protein